MHTENYTPFERARLQEQGGSEQDIESPGMMMGTGEVVDVGEASVAPAAATIVAVLPVVCPPPSASQFKAPACRAPLSPFGALWVHWSPFGPIRHSWDHFGSFGPIGPIWVHWGPLAPFGP